MDWTLSCPKIPSLIGGLSWILVIPAVALHLRIFGPGETNWACRLKTSGEIQQGCQKATFWSTNAKKTSSAAVNLSRCKMTTSSSKTTKATAKLETPLLRRAQSLSIIHAASTETNGGGLWFIFAQTQFSDGLSRRITSCQHFDNKVIFAWRRRPTVLMCLLRRHKWSRASASLANAEHFFFFIFRRFFNSSNSSNTCNPHNILYKLIQNTGHWHPCYWYRSWYTDNPWLQSSVPTLVNVMPSFCSYLSTLYIFLYSHLL